MTCYQYGRRVPLLWTRAFLITSPLLTIQQRRIRFRVVNLAHLRQQLPDSRGGLLGAAPIQVPIHADCGLYRLVAEVRLNHRQRYAGSDHPRGARVAQIVNARRRVEHGALDCGGHAPEETVQAPRAAAAVDEQPLACVVELVEHRWRHVDRALALAGL